MLAGKGDKERFKVIGVSILLLLIVFSASFKAFSGALSKVAGREGVEWSTDGLGGWVREVKWNPRGDLIAVAVGGLGFPGSNGSLRIYGGDGAILWSINLSSPVISLSWHDNDSLVFIGKNGFIEAVDVRNKLVLWNTSLDAFLNDLALSGDSEVILAAGPPLSSVVVLDYNNGKTVFSKSMNGGVLDVEYYPSQRLVSACSGESSTVPSRGEVLLLTVKGETVAGTVFNSECLRAFFMEPWNKLAVAMGFPHYTLKLMKIEGEVLEEDASTALGGVVVDLLKLDDYLVAGVGRPGSKVLVYMNGLKLFKSFEPGEGDVTSVSVNEEERLIAVTTEWFDPYLNPRGGVYIYDIEDGLVTHVTLEGRCSSSDWSPRGEIAVGTKEGGLYVLNLGDIRVYPLITPLSLLASIFTSLAFIAILRKAWRT